MDRTVFQTGIIDVGAHSVRLEIFEVKKDGSCTLLESLTRATRLGTDVFRTGFVSPETASAFSRIMCDYAARLREYGITRIRAFATSAIREARNRELIIDRIRQDSGISLEILEAAREIELVGLALLRQLSEEEKKEQILAMVIGSGSLFVMLVCRGTLSFAEEIPLGTDRLAELFGAGMITLEQFSEELRALDIPRRLAESTGFDINDPVHLVTMGAAPRLVTGVRSGAFSAERPEAIALMQSFRQTPCEEVSRRLGVSSDDAVAAVCAAVMLECFLQMFNAFSFSCFSISTREAAVELMIREEVVCEKEPFRKELRSICRAVGHKYGFDGDHAETVSMTAAALLASLKEEFDFPPRAEMLLETAAMLHDIGRFVDTRDHNLHSAYLISATQLPGLKSEEHHIAAMIAGAHRGDVERAMLRSGSRTMLPEHRVLVLKLAAILRVADALDCARKGKFRNLVMHRRGVVLELRGSGSDFHSEIRELGMKGEVFSQVFGIKVSIAES
jgi:exopolyphosphatase/guanosine-5'-triphosphate,3'-diphosphate pyrophosphatase